MFFDTFKQDKDQRSMDIETAKQMLHLLLGKQWHMYPEFADFLQQSKYKVINKDQWCNILEFSRTISGDLSNYDVDGACKLLINHLIRKSSKPKNFNLLMYGMCIDFLLFIQGPFCWTNLWNGYVKSAVTSAEATPHKFKKVKTFELNNNNSIYIFSHIQKQKFHQFNQLNKFFFRFIHRDLYSFPCVLYSF